MAASSEVRVTLPGTGLEFIHRKGAWLAVRRDGSAATIDVAPAAFLAWLELSQADAEQVVTAALGRDGHIENGHATLPWIDIVLAGLRASSAYWQELALVRLPMNVTRSIMVEIARLETEGGSQRVRQLARTARTKR